MFPCSSLVKLRYHMIEVCEGAKLFYTTICQCMGYLGPVRRYNTETWTICLCDLMEVLNGPKRGGCIHRVALRICQRNGHRIANQRTASLSQQGGPRIVSTSQTGILENPSRLPRLQKRSCRYPPYRPVHRRAGSASHADFPASLRLGHAELDRAPELRSVKVLLKRCKSFDRCGSPSHVHRFMRQLRSKCPYQDRRTRPTKNDD